MPHDSDGGAETKSSSKWRIANIFRSSKTKWVILSLIFLTVVVVYYISKGSGLDPTNACPVDDKALIDEDKLAGEVAVLIDASDSINVKFQTTVRLDTLLKALPAAVRVQFYSIEHGPESNQDIGSLATFCTMAPWKRYRHLFDTKDRVDRHIDKYLEAIDSLLNVGEATSTPLLERLSEISADAFMGRNSASDREATKDLWIVSDMLQHSESCSFYGNPPCVNADSLIQHPDFPARWKMASLSNVDVKVFHVPRVSADMGNIHPSIRDPGDLEEFWRKMFEKGSEAKSFEWHSVAN